MATRLLPLNRRYVVEPDHFRNGGLISRPDSIVPESPTSGVIREVPAGCEYGVGVRVLFAPWSGIEIKIGGRPAVVLAESEILALVEETAA